MDNIDIKGQRFGSLTAVGVSRGHNVEGETIWECVCECGATVYATGSALRGGRTNSCEACRDDHCVWAQPKTIDEIVEVLQTHGPGCWRWPTHWQCAVALVEAFAVATTDMLDALDTEFKGPSDAPWKTTNYPGLLMDAANKLIELIAKVEGVQDESLPT